VNELALAGLIAGIVELGLGALAFKLSKQPALEWLKTFAIGMLLLATSHIVCKFVGHGILGLPRPYAIGVPFKAVGLALVMYSIFKGVNYKRLGTVKLLIAIFAALFWAGSWYALVVLDNPASPFFVISHIAYLMLFTYFLGALLFETYVASGDPSSLAFAIGFIIYGSATLINMAMVHLGMTLPTTAMSTVALIVRVIGVATMLLGFLVVS